MTKRILGIVLIAIPVLVVFGLYIYLVGWKVGLTAIVSGILIAAMIYGGVSLLVK
jgi:hypothetical protein